MSARRRPFRLTAPVVPEHSIQRAMADTLRIEIGPPGRLSRLGVCWYAVDLANYAGEVPGVRVGRGMVSGVPDFFFLYRGRAFFLEVKTIEGELTDAQQSVTAALLCSGGRVGVARDVDEMLICLDVWELPRARLIKIEERAA